jgi:RimJ/RimL family protein N-acetyltransferase
MEKAFTSSRLIYRAVEENDEDKKFIHESIQMDPINFALSDNSIFRPQTKKLSDNITTSISTNCLLGVMICLPAKPTKQTNGDSSNKEEEESKSEPEPTPIGFVTLSRSDPNVIQHRRTIMGITLAKPYQGKGYGTEAVNWALDWAFRHGGLHSVSLQCFSYNSTAEKMYRKLGFVDEGRHREALWFDGEWHDEIHFSMLQSEWRALMGR